VKGFGSSHQQLKLLGIVYPVKFRVTDPMSISAVLEKKGGSNQEHRT
jgi:hypothetical protein